MGSAVGAGVADGAPVAEGEAVGFGFGVGVASPQVLEFDGFFVVPEPAAGMVLKPMGAVPAAGKSREAISRIAGTSGSWMEPRLS